MGTKTISIMDDAYNILVSKKHRGESFSEVIRKLAKTKKDIMQFAGVWEKIPMKEIEIMKAKIRNLRENATKDLFKNSEK